MEELRRYLKRAWQRWPGMVELGREVEGAWQRRWSSTTALISVDGASCNSSVLQRGTPRVEGTTSSHEACREGRLVSYRRFSHFGRGTKKRGGWQGSGGAERGMVAADFGGDGK